MSVLFQAYEYLDLYRYSSMGYMFLHTEENAQLFSTSNVFFHLVMLTVAYSNTKNAIIYSLMNGVIGMQRNFSDF